MAKTILVPVDGSEQSEEALEFAITEFPEDDIVALTVINPAEAGYAIEGTAPDFPSEWYESARDEAENLLTDAERQAQDSDVSIRTTTEIGRPANTIVEYAEENAVDQIVMGSHGRTGMSRILLGSVAETVMRRSPVPVTIVR